VECGWLWAPPLRRRLRLAEPWPPDGGDRGSGGRRAIRFA